MQNDSKPKSDEMKSEQKPESKENKIHHQTKPQYDKRDENKSVKDRRT